MEFLERLAAMTPRPETNLLICHGVLAPPRATAHGAFDDNPATLKATRARILNQANVVAGFEHHRSDSSNRARRSALTRETRFSPGQ